MQAQAQEKSFIDISEVVKVYGTGGTRVSASDNVSFTIKEGEFCVIVGPSGAGKTTVLNLLGGMESCDSGHIIIDGEDIAGFNERQLTDFRRNHVGFVFQSYNLMANLTARENVEIASEICENHLSADDTLAAVGLLDRAGHFPAQLSGGEQQRVSIARALAKRPKLLLCDEPTGALDFETGKQVLKVLHETCRRERMTTVVITHNQVIAEMADRVITIKNGRVQAERINEQPADIDGLEW